MRPRKTRITTEPPAPIDDGDPDFDPSVVWTLSFDEREALAAGGRFRLRPRGGRVAVSVAPPPKR